ncbi:TIGR04219 family outer membrane beta-barrel protein [Thalassotalea sediminis]|uniref:TIGR04219 family outer membrane beta-barrel protein n=1 Tax=Thalassotalea sediminis TaxID=1759089 RepID=UPI002574766F|nr:TIGR04219 family outer membrane beta-barrel protein [Thalassotalea sediminis]
MIKKALVAVFLLILVSHVQADSVGLYVGGQIWQGKVNGEFGNETTTTDFDLKKEEQRSFFVAIEHPFPMLPNFRVSHTTYDTSSKLNVTQASSYTDEASGIVHESIVDTDIDTRFNVRYVDYTFYYELFDNRAFSLDLGVTARDFGGAIAITENSTRVDNWHDIFGTPYTFTYYDNVNHRINTNDIEPMLYIATNVGLPVTGVSLFAQGDFLLKSHHTISDYNVGIMYNLINSQVVDFNVAIGYRAVKMAFNNDENLTSDASIKGGFISVVAHF